jgi:hypothetical protein
VDHYQRDRSLGGDRRRSGRTLDHVEGKAMSSFTQAERDYYLLIVRDFSERERLLVSVVLEALAVSSRESNQVWSADDLDLVAKLTRGETT